MFAVVGILMVLSVSALAIDAVYATNRISDGRHWGQGSLSREFVTIVDNTDSKWPVYAAALKWDEAPKIDVVYKYGTCSGSYGHCVGVGVISASQYPYGGCLDSGGYAVVSPYSSSNNHINPDESFIRFNGDCGRDAFTNRDRRALACEEEGHMIGLDHANYDLYSSTCMASGPITRLKETPRQHDFDLVDSIYTHGH
ncbi:MAG: hypothetical protein M3N53_13120 [Actinomycetota bacterium]|nr:hypothetical protein [Actinomycetota bacterium]